MTRVTIHDEATRTLLIGALWREVFEVHISETFADRFGDLGLSPWQPEPGCETGFDQRIAAACALRDEIKSLAAAGLGEPFNVTVSAERIRHAIEGWVAYLETEGGEWAKAEDPRVLTAFLWACGRLRSELPVAEAVA